MKSLKLKKVKISRIGNPHILFGGASNKNACQTTLPPPPPTMVNEECIKSKLNRCDTVTNTLQTYKTDPLVGNGLG